VRCPAAAGQPDRCSWLVAARDRGREGGRLADRRGGPGGRPSLRRTGPPWLGPRCSWWRWPSWPRSSCCGISPDTVSHGPAVPAD